MIRTAHLVLASTLAIILIGPPLGHASPMEPQLLDGESYYESLTVVADLNDDTYIFVQFGYSNLGSGDGHGACRAQIMEKNKEPWMKIAKYDRDEWHYASQPVPQVSLGACRIWQGRNLELHVPIEGSVIRLTVEGKIREVAPPGSEIKTDDGFYHYQVLIPMAKVRAEWSVDGAPGKSAEGFGYVDKLRSTAMPADVADLWVRFRVFQPDGILVVGRIPPKQGKPDLWYWRPGTDAAPTRGVSFSLGGTEPGAAKHKLMLDLGAGGVIELDSGQEIFRYAPVEKYGWIGIFAKAVVGSPVTRTFRPEVHTPKERYPKSLLEISYVD
ncbi:MAG: hypothetical protein VX834_08325 [Myxococcota bacterium]|nr:hypothetical protein [Myxococcota bacterium]